MFKLWKETEFKYWMENTVSIFIDNNLYWIRDVNKSFNLLPQYQDQMLQMLQPQLPGFQLCPNLSIQVLVL